MEWNWKKALQVSLLVLVVDFIWIGVIAKNMYKKGLAKVQGFPIKFRPIGAIVAYILLIVGLTIFVNDWLSGSIMGLVTYGIYNATNYATLSNYSEQLAITDTLWGTILSAFVGFVTKEFR